MNSRIALGGDYEKRFCNGLSGKLCQEYDRTDIATVQALLSEP